jgi:ABC-type polysaccharide/polyol phosphate export permease
MIQHLTAIWKFRHFLMALVKLDLRLRYRRSVLGIGWSLLKPLSMTAVFATMFTGMLGGGDPARYVPHLIIGMAVWEFLRECLVTGCKSLVAGEAYIRQSPLPYGIYPLRTVLGQAIHSSIALGIALVVTFIYRPETNPLGILYAIPGILLMFFSAWSVATIFSFLNVYFQDTSHLLEVGAQLVFFLSPIMILPELLASRGLQWLMDINPVAMFLELIRTPIMNGVAPPPLLLLSAVGFTAILGALAVGTTAWLQKRVIFHL